MNTRLTLDRIPSLDGRTFIVTGANSGIGWEATRMFASRGARVILACRSAKKTEEAMGRIRAEMPRAQLEFMALDLSSLASIRGFAAAFCDRHPRLDALVNNAGVMAIPARRTADGFEMQLGTNHLGHFALTGLLLDRLVSSAPSRVVTVSSGAHRAGRIDFEDLNWERSYSKWGAYGRSKLANLLFTFEMARRLSARGLTEVRAIACHPGYASTNLQSVGSQMEGGSRFEGWIMALGNATVAQSAEKGALPTVFATADPDANSGDYIGPSGIALWRGTPRRCGSNARSRDDATAKRLWSVSEDLTGVRFLDD